MQNRCFDCNGHISDVGRLRRVDGDERICSQCFVARNYKQFFSSVKLQKFAM